MSASEEDNVLVHSLQHEETFLVWRNGVVRPAVLLETTVLNRLVNLHDFLDGRVPGSFWEVHELELVRCLRFSLANLCNSLFVRHYLKGSNDGLGQSSQADKLGLLAMLSTLDVKESELGE